MRVEGGEGAKLVVESEGLDTRRRGRGSEEEERSRDCMMVEESS